MPELDPINQPLKDKVRHIQEQQKKHVLVASMKMRKGSTMYSWNVQTNELREVEYETLAVYVDPNDAPEFVPGIPIKAATGWITKRKAIVEEFCIYVRAINTKNAIKKFNRLLQREGFELIPPGTKITTDDDSELAKDQT